MRKREKLNAMLPNIAVSKCLCYSCVDNSPQHYSVFCVRTAAATCCRLQEPDDIVPPDTSYEDGVTTATVCRVLTGWQLTCGPWLVWVHWVPATGHIITGHRDQEATPAQALPLDNSGIQLWQVILPDQTQVISMSVSGFRGNCHINCTYSDNEMHCTFVHILMMCGVWGASQLAKPYSCW